jgi:DNA-directed RNA polymerase specialized sigma24 family protein
MTKEPATDPIDLDDYLDFKSATDSLPPMERLVVLLLADGYSLRGISAFTGTSLEEAKNNIVRAFMSINDVVPAIMWTDFLAALCEAEKS